MRFVLASASPARLAVLRAAGIEPSVVVSGVDEEALTASLPSPSRSELVTALAQAKADDVVDTVAATHRDVVIVGCDSMLSIGGEMVGKPGTVDVARKRWADMAGGSGELLTGHAVIRLAEGEHVAATSGTETTTVRFGTPSPEELESYLDTGEPLSVAGGFTLDGFGSWFIDGIDGDPSSVTGISLPLTRRLLAQIGLSITDLWTDPSIARRFPQA